MIYTLFCSCRKTRPFRINRLGTLCAEAKTSNPLFSVHCALFCKTPGVGYPTLPRRASLPPSYAPRGASIPCTLTRLRILPVTTGCVPLRKLVRCTEAQKCLSVTPLFATLKHSMSRKSFPCHSYANTRDGAATVAPVSAPFFSPPSTTNNL